MTTQPNTPISKTPIRTVSDKESITPIKIFQSISDEAPEVAADIVKVGMASADVTNEILAQLQGAAADPTKIGEEYMPEGLVQYDESDNVYTGPTDNRIYDGVLGDISTGYRISGFLDIGNINIPDQQGLIWRDPNGGAPVSNIRHWRGHDSFGGETLFESAWRIAILSQGPTQFGHNNALPTAQVLHIACGESTVNDTIKHSRAISFQTKRYNGGGAAVQRAGYFTCQATSLTDNTESTVLRFATVEGSSDIGSVEGFNGGGGTYTKGISLGIDMAEFSADGIWNAGLYGTATALNGASDFVWTVSKYKTFQVATVTLTGNRSMSWGGTLLAGMRGRLYVTQDGTGSRKMLLPAGSLFALGGYPDLSTAANAVDILEWDYDGVNTYWRFVNKAFANPAYPGAPSIAGNTSVEDVLTVTTGGLWSGFQWYSGVSAVSGQTASTYTIRHQDIGQNITCREGGVPSNIIVAWHPDDESGYFADYRADLGLYQSAGGAAATAHGATVGEWQDQSGNARHVTNPTADERPTLDLTTYASYPHVRFDGGDYLYKAVAMTRPQTVFVVMESESIGANKRMYAAAVLGTRMLMGHELSGTGRVQNNSAATASSTLPVNTRAIVMARTTSTQNTIRLNTSTEVVATEATGDGDKIMIGGSSAANSITGRIFAVLVYMGDLDAAAQTKVQAYLKAKWNTP